MTTALLFIIYLACVFGVTATFARVCGKPWYPRRFPIVFGAMATLVIGGLSGFGMWWDANTINRGVPE